MNHNEIKEKNVGFVLLYLKQKGAKKLNSFFKDYILV